MKKIYLSPETESTAISAMELLVVSIDQSQNQPGGQGGPSGPPGGSGAPRRPF